MFVAYFNIKDENHERSIPIIEDIARDKYGAVFTSDYIIDETLTVILQRTKNVKNAIKAGLFMMGEIEDIPLSISLIRVSKKIFDQAWKLFKVDKYRKSMSFTDYTSAILINNYAIKMIASFDPHFDGILSRIF